VENLPGHLRHPALRFTVLCRAPRADNIIAAAKQHHGSIAVLAMRGEKIG
jgi:hypothetical protein